jgi:predicted nucleic acid-binding protein
VRRAQFACARSPAPRRLVQRQPPGAAPPAGGAPARRIVLIDANVLEQINRGNASAATTIRNLSASVDVYISRQAYNEAVVNTAIPRHATAQRLMLEELRIRIAPQGNLAARAAVYEANITPSGSVLSPADAATAAQARAINAEVWSFDRAFRVNYNSVQQTLGVRVAPESYTTGLATSSQDYRVGRQLLGLQPVEISLSGVVTRGGPAGGGPGGGGAPGPGGPSGPAGASPAPGPRPPTGASAAPAGTASGAAREIARDLNKEMTRNLKLLRGAAVLRTALLVLQGVVALLQLKAFTQMAESKLAGKGFVLTKELEKAEAVAEQARELEGAYPGFSESIQSKGFQLLLAPVHTGSLGELLIPLLSMKSDLEELRKDLGTRTSQARKALDEVTRKRKAAEAILEDPKASAALAAATFGTAELAFLFGVWDDLGHLEGRLSTAINSLDAVRKMVDADIDFLSAWWSYLAPIWQAAEVKAQEASASAGTGEKVDAALKQMDFQGAFLLLNGCSMEMMLKILKRLRAEKQLDALSAKSGSAEGVHRARIVLAIRATYLRGAPEALSSFMSDQSNIVELAGIESEGQAAIKRVLATNRD